MERSVLMDDKTTEQLLEELTEVQKMLRSNDKKASDDYF